MSESALNIQASSPEDDPEERGGDTGTPSRHDYRHPQWEEWFISSPDGHLPWEQREKAGSAPEAVVPPEAPAFTRRQALGDIAIQLS